MGKFRLSTFVLILAIAALVAPKPPRGPPKWTQSHEFCAQNQALYDSDLKRCVHLVGTHCFGATRYPELNIFQCGLENTGCDTEGWCSCVPGTYVANFTFGEGDLEPLKSCVPLLKTAKIPGRKGPAGTVPGVRGYGDSCDPDPARARPCIATLVCSEGGVCTCQNPERSVWRREDGLCYSDEYCESRRVNTFYEPASGRCKSIVGRPYFGANTCTGPKDTSSCPLNAECIPNRRAGFVTRVCACKEGYEAAGGETRCLPVLGYGDECVGAVFGVNITSVSSACGTTMRCSLDGYCSCDELKEAWDPQERVCKLRAGQPCVGEAADSCARGAKCVKGVCACEGGYQLHPETGTCLAPYLGHCSLKEDCASGLECVDSACRCRSLWGQIWDPDEARPSCRTLVGSPCGADGALRCVEDAYCDPRTGLCRCDEGHTATSNGARCYLPKGHGDACGGTATGSCDPAKGLACVNDACTCADASLKYDKRSGACLAALGGRCGRHPVSGPGACFQEMGTNATRCEMYNVACAQVVGIEGVIVCSDSGAGIFTCQGAN